MVVGVVGRLAIFIAHNVHDALNKERAFVRGMLDGLRGRMDPDAIEVHFPIRHWDLRPGRAQRIREWFGA